MKLPKQNLHFLALSLSALLAGCVATTTDVDRLQDSMNAVQKGQADLIVRMNELDRSILGLGEKLGDSKEKTAALARQLEDIHARLGERMQTIATLLSQATTYASVAVPGDAYRMAYADYQSGKIDMAVSGFLSFLERYPDSNLADSAQFYLADCYLIKKEFAKAGAAFDRTLATSREFRAQALLKRSYALEGLRQPAAQEATLKALLKEFPSSPEAGAAKQILEELKPKPKPKPKPKQPGSMRRLALLSILFLQSAGVHATDIYLQIQRGGKVSVGLPDFTVKGTSEDDKKLAKEIREVVKDDILFSKTFNIAEDGPAAGGKRIDFKAWNDLGADILVTAAVSKKEEKGKVKVQMVASVFELPDGNPVFQKSYATLLENSRQIAHAFTADFLYRFTGNRGVSQTKIAFANTMTGDKELYVVDYDGKNVRKLTSDKSVALLPRWSPDGNGILYTSFVRNNPDTFLFSFDKGRSKPFSSRPGLNTPAAFSPDGQQVVVTLSCGGFPNLYLLNREGKILRRLTNTKAADTTASFSPDGRKIVFTSDRPGWPQIYTMDADGSNIKRLSTSGYCDASAWSPSGDQITYSRRTAAEGHHDIVLLDLASGNAIQVTKDMGNNEDPSFSPDGKYLVFTSTRDKKRDLYISSLDGTMQKKLVDTLGQCFTPAWGPN